MKKVAALVVLMFTIIIAWSCGSSLKVQTDYDKSVDFAKYKTFAIYNAQNIHDAISQMNQSRVYNAIRAEMIKKGFAEDSTSPDMLVNTTAVLKDRTSASSTDYYNYGSMYRPYTWGPGVSYSTYDVRHYKDGSLIIDVVETDSKKLLWQGTGNKEIDAPLKDPDTQVPKGIAAIMKNFPPKNKNSK
jgi:hypothetical protein